MIELNLENGLRIPLKSPLVPLYKRGKFLPFLKGEQEGLKQGDLTEVIYAPR